MSNSANGVKISAPVLGAIVAGVVGLSSIVSAVAISKSNTSAVLKNINIGNEYIEASDYDKAIASYQAALEIDGRNPEAMQDLMQAAYLAGDYELLADTLSNYADYVVEYEGVSDELVKMSQAAASGFATPELYVEYATKIYEADDSDNAEEILKNARVSSIISYIQNGDYESANNLLTKIQEDGDDDFNELWIEVLKKCAEQCWERREFEKAIEFLKIALENSDNSQSVKDSLLIVAENYVTDLRNNQKYEEALEIIRWLQGLRGDDSLSYMVSDIETAKSSDSMVQGLIENLNAAFDSDNISWIEEIMNSGDFISGTSGIRGVLFSNSLLSSDGINGHGTAIYNVYGKLYVYYGSFVNGKREGQGLWYYSDDIGHLAKYNLQWVNDFPNGPGSSDTYSTLTTHAIGGAIVAEHQTHKSDTFTTVNGIFDGPYHSHGSSTYEYDLDWVYYNGYASRIDVGNYPSEITRYMSYPVPLMTYADVYGHYIWGTWSPEQEGIDGVMSTTSSIAAISLDNVEIY